MQPELNKIELKFILFFCQRFDPLRPSSNELKNNYDYGEKMSLKKRSLTNPSIKKIIGINSP